MSREFQLEGKPLIGKWGHSGTLDPFAQGLLICAVGNATRLIPLMNWESKTYEAVLKLGTATDTQDLEGQVISTLPVPNLTIQEIEQVLLRFKGRQLQTPPLFSAKKVAGKRAYQYAREGKTELVLRQHEIEILDIKLLSWCQDEDNPHATAQIKLLIECSAGTYVRTIGHDIALQLGTVGHLTYLKRVAIGNFMVPEPGKEKWIGVSEWVSRLSPKMRGVMPTLHFEVNPFEASLLKNGTIPNIYRDKVVDMAKSNTEADFECAKYPLLLEFWYGGFLRQIGWHWQGQQKIIAQVEEV